MSKKSSKNLIDHKRIDTIYKNISGYIHTARSNVLRTIDTEMVKAYWLIGRDIVEEEQSGKEKSTYGSFLLEELSSRLKKEFGEGFGRSTLADIRKFYLTYQIVHAVRGQSGSQEFNPKLSWTHYRALMREGRPEVREFYELEATENCWSARELERQMGSLLFDRLAKSKDKKGLMKLVHKGQEVTKPEDAIKEPVVLEFVGLPEYHKLIESKLEEALISNLQSFLLELGKGFAFIARQKRLTLDGNHFYADLVFYHTILKAYVVIDIKTNELSHADLGQMQLYVNYFNREIRTEGDNPTIGLVLCTEKNDTMVKYFFDGENKNIFASKYLLHLPTEKELKEELEREIKNIKYQLEHK